MGSFCLSLDFVLTRLEKDQKIVSFNRKICMLSLKGTLEKEHDGPTFGTVVLPFSQKRKTKFRILTLTSQRYHFQRV